MCAKILTPKLFISPAPPLPARPLPTFFPTLPIPAHSHKSGLKKCAFENAAADIFASWCRRCSSRPAAGAPSSAPMFCNVGAASSRLHWYPAPRISVISSSSSRSLSLSAMKRRHRFLCSVTVVPVQSAAWNIYAQTA